MGFVYYRPQSGPSSLPPSGAAGGVLTGTYPNPGLASQVVQNTHLAPSAVTDAKIADGAVTGAKLVDNSIGGSKISNGSVTKAKLADDAKIVPRVTALPTSGMANGDEVDLFVPGMNCLWRFRYDTAAAGAYKWIFVGGPPVWSYDDGDFGFGLATAWTLLNPSITLPVRGFFLFSWGHATYWNQAASEHRFYLSVTGPGIPSDDNGRNTIAVISSPANAYSMFSVARERHLEMSSVGGVVQLIGRSSGIPVSSVNRWMSVTPVRCAG